jgi:hypothetical protein
MVVLRVDNITGEPLYAGAGIILIDVKNAVNGKLNRIMCLSFLTVGQAVIIGGRKYDKCFSSMT